LKVIDILIFNFTKSLTAKQKYIRLAYNSYPLIHNKLGTVFA